DSEQGRRLSTLDAAPELALCCNDQVLIKRVGGNLDLDPFAATSDDREHGGPCGHYPHVVLQLRRVLLNGGLFRERPRQHEFGLEDRLAGPNASIQRSPHPTQARMPAVL